MQVTMHFHSQRIGFQIAIGCSQPGMPWIGTNALDMNVSGRKMMNPVCCRLRAAQDHAQADPPG